MLCLLAWGRIANFKLDAEEIRMRSMARFIGGIERNGQLRQDRVLFRDGAAKEGGGATVALRSPLHLGFRQLQHER